MSKFSRSLWSQTDPAWWNIAQWADTLVILGGIALLFLSGMHANWLLFAGVALSVVLNINRTVRHRRAMRRDETWRE